ncbi:MAG TPA: hypothetical protein GXZ31_05875, partial [Thermoanaerobacterales bacterium]|nr:hypothetical protein [Thermoanaerobacterales bacterium]
PDALRCLQNYPWPGNIRELENTLEQMAVMTPGSTITLGDLPPNLRNESNSDIERWQGYTLKDAVREFENRIIEQTVASTPNLAAAAESLGIDISTLTRKRRRYRESSGKLQLLSKTNNHQK